MSRRFFVDLDEPALRLVVEAVQAYGRGAREALSSVPPGYSADRCRSDIRDLDALAALLGRTLRSPPVGDGVRSEARH